MCYSLHWYSYICVSLHLHWSICVSLHGLSAGHRRPYGMVHQRGEGVLRIRTVSPGELVTWPSRARLPSSTVACWISKPVAAPTSLSFCASRPTPTRTPSTNSNRHNIATDAGITDIDIYTRKPLQSTRQHFRRCKYLYADKRPCHWEANEPSVRAILRFWAHGHLVAKPFLSQCKTAWSPCLSRGTHQASNPYKSFWCTVFSFFSFWKFIDVFFFLLHIIFSFRVAKDLSVFNLISVFYLYLTAHNLNMSKNWG